MQLLVFITFLQKRQKVLKSVDLLELTLNVGSNFLKLPSFDHAGQSNKSDMAC